jgi:hypothetical protein
MDVKCFHFFLDVIAMNKKTKNNYDVNVLWKWNIACLWVLENDLVSTMWVIPILVDRETGWLGKLISLDFHAY